MTDIQDKLTKDALSEWSTWRTYATHHHLSTEEIILTAKAMDFLENFGYVLSMRI